MSLIFESCAHYLNRVAILVREARKAMNSSSPTSPPAVSNGHAEKGEYLNTPDEMLREAEAVATGLESYIERCSNLPNPTSQSTKLVEEMIEGAQTTDWATLYATGKISYRLTGAMSSNRYEAGMVTFLCGLLRPRRVLEIGMFTGTMTTVFASAPSVEQVISLEYEPFLEGWCRAYWKKAGNGLNEKIDVRVGAAKDKLEEMARNGEAPFDMILIDADKDSYVSYFRQIIKHKLLSKNGVMLIDNVLFRATPYVRFPEPLLTPTDVDQDSVKKINKFGRFLDELNLEISDHPDVEVMMLPIRDGLSLVKWKDA